MKLCRDTIFNALVAIFSLLTMLVVGGMIYLSTDSGQQLLFRTVVEQLRERLGTRVEVNKIDVSLFDGSLSLYDTEIGDRRDSTMLRVDTLQIGVNIMPLLNKELSMRYLELAGADIRLYKVHKDSAINCQFVVDAFKSKKERKSKVVMDIDRVRISRANVRWDVLTAPLKGGDTLDTNHLALRDMTVSIKANVEENGTMAVTLRQVALNETKTGMRLTAEKMKFHTLRKRNVSVKVEDLFYAYRDKKIACHGLSVYQKKGYFDLRQPMRLKMDSLYFHNDNGRPRKNVGRPHRGAFDPGHMDAVVTAEVLLKGVKGDTINMELKRLKGVDKGSGLKVKNMRCQAAVTKERTIVTDLHVLLKNSELTAKEYTMSYGKNSGVVFDDHELRGRICLQDISQPFAPVLSGFTTPLNLSVRCGGTAEKFLFKDIKVHTDDRLLTVSAQGAMYDADKRKALHLLFTDIKMKARGNVKERLVKHFSDKVRLKMMRQLKAIGDIRYNGRVGVFYKRVTVDGDIALQAGKVHFALNLDGKVKRIQGTVNTDSIDLGAIMNVKKLRLGKTTATFDIDNDKRHKRSKAHEGGRLPIGTMTAKIDVAKVKFLKVKDITANVVSDGSVAHGTTDTHNKLIQTHVDFDYIQTDSVQTLKIHPKIRLGKEKKNKKKQDKSK